MVVTVALLGGEASGRAALAHALRDALALQAPDVAVAIDDTPTLSPHSQYNLTLLLGLNPSDGPLGEAADTLLRNELHSAGIAFQLVHGQGSARVQQALRAIGRATGRALVVDDPALTLGRVPWTCENCSDPDCEHRLFTGLVARP